MRVPTVTFVCDAGIFTAESPKPYIEELYSFLREDGCDMTGEIFVSICYVPKEVAEAKRTMASTVLPMTNPEQGLN